MVKLWEEHDIPTTLVPGWLEDPNAPEEKDEESKPPSA